MTNFTEITIAEKDEAGRYAAVRGSKLIPYVTALNEVSGFTAHIKRKQAEAQGLPLPEANVKLNLDEDASENGFRLMQQKVVLVGFWGADRLAEDDLEAFGKLFPEVHLSLIEASTPKPNGDLGALRNYVRRDYLAGKRVGTWKAAHVQWEQSLHY